MDVVARIEELLAQRGWSKYHLAKEANLSQSTISSMVIRGNNPTITTIEGCCKAFGITLAEFFEPDAQDKEFTLEERRLISDWRNLLKKRCVMNYFIRALPPCIPNSVSGFMPTTIWV